MRANKWITGVLSLAAAAVTQAALYTWDGGASTTNFGDQANWDPDGTTYTTADDYTIDNGSSVSVGGSYDVGSIDLKGNSGALTIQNGATLSIANRTSSELSYIEADSTFTVNGTFATGSNRYDLRGAGGTISVIVNGTFSGTGNNGITDDSNVLFDINDGGVYDLSFRSIKMSLV